MTDTRPEIHSFPLPPVSHGTASHGPVPQGTFSHGTAGSEPAPNMRYAHVADDFEPADAELDSEFDECDTVVLGAEQLGEHDDAHIAGRISPVDESAPGELVELVLRLGQRVRGHLDTRFGAFGLSDARFAALSVIREAAPSGCTQAHLATRLGQCESSISTLVERMRASRLLYRLRAKADRRKRVLMLTDDGRRLFEEGLACRDREAAALFARFPEDDRQALAGLLGRLFGSLDSLPASDRAERASA